MLYIYIYVMGIWTRNARELWFYERTQTRPTPKIRCDNWIIHSYRQLFESNHFFLSRCTSSSGSHVYTHCTLKREYPCEFISELHYIIRLHIEYKSIEERNIMCPYTYNTYILYTLVANAYTIYYIKYP